MAQPKHKPQRTCIICRETKDKREMLRVVRTPTGQVIIDPTGKANGRGAYLCRRAQCWEKGLQQKERLAQALKTTLSTEDIKTLQMSVQTELARA